MLECGLALPTNLKVEVMGCVRCGSFWLIMASIILTLFEVIYREVILLSLSNIVVTVGTSISVLLALVSVVGLTLL